MATYPSADLDWDHSAGENLLDDFEEDFNSLQFYNGSLMNDSTSEDQESVKLSRRHLSFLLRSLTEAGSLLREQHNLQNALSTRIPQRNPQPESSKCRQSCEKAFRTLTKYNLVITLTLQTIMLVIVTVLDAVNKGDSKGNHSDVHDWLTYVVMLTICSINLCLVIYISVQLTKTMIHSRASAIMLAQAYLSTVTMFAGLYVITYRIDSKGWTLHGFNKEKDDELIIISYLFLKMLYHSISTSTLCGSSTIHPDAWYNFILMSIQMLLSFLYFASILKLAVEPSPRKRIRLNPRLVRRASNLSLASTDHTRLLNGNATTTRYGGL
ncbi:uncharacterized protein [Watersipora subatra]|uniref:uncharacterized protein isoform X1 n=1 Tax=Watersipora subatra TaxID=2589382 RepID=UPI00355B8530